MLNQKGFSALLIIIVIFIVMGLGMFVYKFLPKDINKQTVSIDQKTDGFYEEEKTPGNTKLRIRKNNAQQVQKLSQRIAFVKNQNVWIAEEGKAFPITGDATSSFSPTFNNSLWYEHPIWSPDGKFLTFVQNFNYSDNVTLLFTDGVYMSQNGRGTGSDLSNAHMPYWYGDNTYIALNFDFNGNGSAYGEIIDDTFFTTTKDQDELRFKDVQSGKDGCGGGGRPIWLNTLSQNHGGSMDGLRSTLFYIKKTKELVHSIGCENEGVMKITSGGKDQLFSTIKDIKVNTTHQEYITGPHSLDLAKNEEYIAGVYGEDIYLFNLNGSINKQLSTTHKAYAPVFSPDNKTIFYSDNLGGNPILMKTDYLGNSTKIFESQSLGAISNVDVSNDGQILLFTLLTQIGDQYDYENGSVKQDIYTISQDGTNLKLFINDASQGNW